MPFLMKFSFGPVQEFIAAARKLEDLWAGSQMLGQLMKTAHDAVTVAGGDIIYPVEGGPDVNLPNVILAAIADRSPLDLAKEVEDQVQTAFYQMIADRLTNAGCLKIEEIIQRQTRDFLDIAWAAADIDHGFNDALRNLGALFDAAKRTRSFGQQVEEGLKCTLQPNLSALAPPEILPEKSWHKDPTIRGFWRTIEGRGDIDRSIVRAVKADSGERFSAIGLAKRLYRWENQEASFPSTYSVATAKWRHRLLMEATDDPAFAGELDTLMKEVNDAPAPSLTLKGHFDIESAYPNTLPALSEHRTGPAGDLLRWEPQCFVETEPPPAEDQRGRALVDIIRRMIRLGEDNGCGLPPRHYALLMADGDSMGEVVNARKEKSDLTDMSRKLNDFAAEAVAAVQNAAICGRAVYAGGDDLLAVSPVETALETACAWRRSYRDKMAGFTFLDENGRETPATLSVALLIAPTNYPLNRLMRDAHHVLENRAKAEDKDALSISVIKGDSEVVSITLPTEAPSADEWRLETWADCVADLAASREISSKCMYDLRKNLGNLTAGGENRFDFRPELIARIVMARLASNRIFDGSGEEGLREGLKTAVMAFLDAMNGTAQNRGGRRFLAPDLIADTLVMLRQMRRLACLSN